MSREFSRLRLPGLWLAITGVVILLAAGDTARASSVPENNGDQWKLCANAIRNQEKAWNIPDHLLTAISVAESGRWHPDLERSVPWPWTVMAEGKGRYFNSREEALQEVEKLRKKGVRNIDVGCMQINLHYHGRNFASIEEAFEPAVNAGYAARFLHDLYEARQSWSTAVGYYHSGTPSKNYPYRRKIMSIWKDNKRHAVANSVAEMDVEMAPSPRPSQPMDDQQLADRRRARLQTARASVQDRREWVKSVMEQRRALHDAFMKQQREKLEAYRNYMADRFDRD